VRQILPGKPYLPVPGLPKIDLRGIVRAKQLVDVFATAPQDPAAAERMACVEVQWVGPILANELVTASVVDGVVVPEELVRHLLDLSARIARSGFEPGFITDEKGPA